MKLRSTAARCRAAPGVSSCAAWSQDLVIPIDHETMPLSIGNRLGPYEIQEDVKDP